MPRLEKFSERIFCQDIERAGGQALKQDAELNAGIPDRLCWLPIIGGGVCFFWVEWKRKGETLKKHQEAYARTLRNCGHFVFVFDNNDEARQIIKDIRNGNGLYRHVN